MLEGSRAFLERAGRGRPGTTMDDDLLWTAVTPDRPCPVCDGSSGCGLAEAERFVVCARVPSPRPIDAGGWLHALAD